MTLHAVTGGRWLRPKFIYWIQAVDGGPIKIGLADAPARRLLMLQTGNPQELCIRRIQRGRASDEPWLHALFGGYRIRGEWFRAHPVLAEMCGGIADPDLVGEPLLPVSTPTAHGDSWRPLWLEWPGADVSAAA